MVTTRFFDMIILIERNDKMSELQTCVSADSSLVIQAAEQMIAAMETPLFVSRERFISMIVAHGLNEEDVANIIEVRENLGGSIPAVRQWLEKGLSTAQILGLYRVREWTDLPGGVSLKAIDELRTTFPSLDPEDDDEGVVAGAIEELLVEAHRRCPWLLYAGQTVSEICETARKYGIADPMTAVEFLATAIPEGGVE